MYMFCFRMIWEDDIIVFFFGGGKGCSLFEVNIPVPSKQCIADIYKKFSYRDYVFELQSSCFFLFLHLLSLLVLLQWHGVSSDMNDLGSNILFVRYCILGGTLPHPDLSWIHGSLPPGCHMAPRYNLLTTSRNTWLPLSSLHAMSWDGQQQGSPKPHQSKVCVTNWWVPGGAMVGQTKGTHFPGSKYIARYYIVHLRQNIWHRSLLPQTCV